MADSLQVQKISKAWQEELLEMEIQNPHLRLQDLAHYFGVSIGHVSIVRNSDAYLEMRALRMRQHQDMVSRSIIDKAQRLAETGLDVMHERIEKDRNGIGMGVVKDATDLALRSLGYGPKPVNVNVDQSRNETHLHLSQDDRAAYERAREKLRVVNQMNTDDIEDAQEVEGEIEHEPNTSAAAPSALTDGGLPETGEEDTSAEDDPERKAG